MKDTEVIVDALLNKPRVVGWVEWDSDRPEPQGDLEPYKEALIEEIRRLNLRRGGFWHQGQTKLTKIADNEPDHGCPLFNDGTALRCSMRQWGRIMAEAHGITDQMGYCEYAWHGPEEGEELDTA